MTNKQSNEMMNTTSSLPPQGNPFAIQAAAGGGALAAITANAAVTEVLASIWIAKQFPRDVDSVKDRMKQSCSQLSLACSATYVFPRGGTSVEGPSIRLAEALISAWGNAEAGWKEVARHWDPKGADGNGCNVSECVAYCFDKETNVRREISFSVPHTRNKNETDSRGKKTGKMLRVTLDNERDIYELCANMASRRIRACILQVVPGWLTEEALEIVSATLKKDDNAEKLPERIQSMEAKFLELGVSRAQLEKKLGHSLEPNDMTMAEVYRLGRVYTSIADGMIRMNDVFPTEEQSEVKDPNIPSVPEAPAPSPDPASNNFKDGIPGLDVPEGGGMFGTMLDH